jgi:hypothetical protein
MACNHDYMPTRLRQLRCYLRGRCGMSIHIMEAWLLERCSIPSCQRLARSLKAVFVACKSTCQLHQTWLHLNCATSVCIRAKQPHTASLVRVKDCPKI